MGIVSIMAADQLIYSNERTQEKTLKVLKMDMPEFFLYKCYLII